MNWTTALPELVLALSGMGILIFGVLNKRDTFQMCSMLVVGAMLVGGMLVLNAPVGAGFNGQFTNDAFSLFAKLLILAAAALSVVVSLDYAEHANIRRFEFPILMLYATIGMMLMVSSTNMMTMYVGVELMSLSIYVLAAFARDELRSSEAGLK